MARKRFRAVVSEEREEIPEVQAKAFVRNRQEEEELLAPEVEAKKITEVGAVRDRKSVV